jgi:prepilin-type N-terminal cleavage/methylation domain-containing protein
MIRSTQNRKGAMVRAREARGFTLLELVIVVAIGMILAGLATPVIINTLRVYKMRTAITSITGLISNARYQSIFHGCKTQIVFTAAAYTYQISSQQPAYGGQACLAAYAPITGVTPIAGSGIAIDQTVTFTFTPGGAVATTPAMSPIQMKLTYPGFTTTVQQEIIQVSNYGNITVTP